jgi:hypothetical protein
MLISRGRQNFGIEQAAREIVARQFTEIKSAHDQVRTLRNTAKKS